MWSSRHRCRHQLTHAEVNYEIVGETLKNCKLRHKSIKRLTRFDHLATHCRMKRLRDWWTCWRKGKQR